jgi:minor extracellular serine protease Vpr
MVCHSHRHTGDTAPSGGNGAVVKPAPSTGSRRSRARQLGTGGVVLATALAAIGGTAAAGSAQQNGTGHREFTKVDVSGSSGNGLHFTPAAQSNRLITVMLQMQGDPVTLHQAAAHENGHQLSKGTQRALRGQLQVRQDQIKPRIAHVGGRVVAQLQDAYNGIQVQVREKNVAALSALPGVVAVHKMRSFKPSNVNGVPFVGGPEAWGTYRQTGKGVKLAVIDTGIDYTHADFGGPGTVAAFKAAAAASTAPADPAMFGPDAPKVKGGTDFVGDDYDANDPTSVPKPDPNPLDCNGHGSHTAGTAAGFGVLSDGKTFGGTYDANTVGAHDWNVGPGVAPQADIYAYRVFGCAGSSNVVAEAIDQAAKDGVDVISMSLGSDLGGTDDPTTVAAENAAKAGISVVAAAGNAGQNAYLLSSPAAGDHVLAVAALDGSRKEYPGAKLTFSTGDTVDTIDANGAPIPSGPLPVKVLRNKDGSISLGCDPVEYTAAGVTGALVVTKRGTCARVARAVYGQEAGAAAVVMLNSDASLPPYEGPITSNPDTGEPYNVTIPFLGAAGTAANATAFNAADGGTVTLADSPVPNTGYEQSASFTSGGPRNPDSAPKPEVIAPGVSVASVGMGTGDGFAIESGTSMATPMTAGTAALVKGAHPGWNGDQIKAAIQNTADPSKNVGYKVRLAGTGAVQAQKAVDSTVLATTENGLNSIAFGFVAGSGDYSSTRTFTLTNNGSAPATYSLSVDPNRGQLGADVTVSPSSVTVAPGASQTVSAHLSMTRSAFAALSSDDTGSVGVGQVMSLGGAVVATPQNAAPSQQTVRVAYLMVPRGLSAVKAGNPSAFTPVPGSSSFRSTLPLRNTGIHAGTADVYDWGITDAKDTAGSSMDVRDVGVQAFAGDALGGDPADRGLVFAVNGWGPATNHSVDEFDVAIDNNRDGAVDFYVVGVDVGAITTGSFDGRFGSFTVNARTGAVVDGFIADAPMNGAVVELPALASELGISSAKSRFDYTVTGFSVLDSALADPTGTASFDPFHPTLNTGQWAELAPGGSATVPLRVDRALQRSLGGTHGWLVVSVDDASGAAQADEVAVPSNLGR